MSAYEIHHEFDGGNFPYTIRYNGQLITVATTRWGARWAIARHKRFLRRYGHRPGTARVRVVERQPTATDHCPTCRCGETP